MSIPVQALLAMGPAAAAVPKFLAVASGTSPYLEIYDATYTKITLPAAAGQFPTSKVGWVSFSKDGKYLAFCTATKLWVYDMSTSPPTALSGGALTAPPAWTALGGIAWNSGGTRLAIIDQTVSPYIWVYDSSTWASVTAPTLTGGPIAVDWSPSGDRIGVGGDNSTFSFKEFDGATMAAAAAPATAPTFPVRGVKYSPNGTHLALHGTSAQNIYLYNRTGMTLDTNPATLPGNASTGQQNLSWTQDGLKLALVAGGSPCFLIYNRSGDTFTNVTTSATQPIQSANAVCFTRDGLKLIVSVSVAAPTPNLLKYDVAGGYTKDADITQPTASVTCIDSTI